MDRGMGRRTWPHASSGDAWVQVPVRERGRADSTLEVQMAGPADSLGVQKERRRLLSLLLQVHNSEVVENVLFAIHSRPTVPPCQGPIQTCSVLTKPTFSRGRRTPIRNVIRDDIITRVQSIRGPQGLMAGGCHCSRLPTTGSGTRLDRKHSQLLLTTSQSGERVSSLSPRSHCSLGKSPYEEETVIISLLPMRQPRLEKGSQVTPGHTAGRAKTQTLGHGP